VSEYIRWKTKLHPDQGGAVRRDILEFYQETTRQRGYPPFPIEIALKYELEMPEAIKEYNEVIRHIAEITIKVERPRQNSPEVAEANLPPKSPPDGPAGVDLKRFTGRNGWPNQRDRMIYWLDAARNGYARGSVDFVLHDEQVALTPETEAYFYSAEAVRLPQYEKGGRPFLEQVVEETTAGCTSDRARALALARLIGNPDTSPYRNPEYQAQYGEGYFKRPLGGTEEEVLRKGWHMCNEISRALVFLSQVAGMPARPVFLFTDPLTGVGGHCVTEIFFDGKWNMVENNWGIMFLMDDGYFASVVELRDHPEIVNSRSDVGGGLCLCHAAFTGPISILPYSIDNVAHYNYPLQAYP